MGFSQKTLALLHRAGWWEERELDRSAIEARLAERGEPISPPVVDFYSRFGGLTVGNETLTVPAPDDESVRAERHPKLGKLVFPAGETGAGAYNGLILYIDLAGNIYGDGMDALYRPATYFIGSSAVEAIDALIQNGRFRPVNL